MVTEGDPDTFDKVRLPPEIDAHLRETNPWWQGLPGRLVPPYRRWMFATMLRKLDAGVAPALVLRGARQVGKTTLQEQTIQFLLVERRIDPRRVLRIQFDELPPFRNIETPILEILRWYQDRILPERGTEPEVDFVLGIGEKRIPVEVKYRRRIDPHRDTLGLRSFLERTPYNAPFAVLVTMLDGVPIPDPRIVPVSLRSLLLTR
jgi:predicted AAA+ superfamily ATPase